MKCTCQMAMIHESVHMPNAAAVYEFMNQAQYREPKFSPYESVNKTRSVNEKLFFHLTQGDVERPGSWMAGPCNAESRRLTVFRASRAPSSCTLAAALVGARLAALMPFQDLMTCLPAAMCRTCCCGRSSRCTQRIQLPSTTSSRTRN